MEVESIPKMGKRMIGNKDVTPNGITSVNQKNAINTTTANIFEAMGFDGNKGNKRKIIKNKIARMSFRYLFICKFFLANYQFFGQFIHIN